MIRRLVDGHRRHYAAAALVVAAVVAPAQSCDTTSSSSSGTSSSGSGATGTSAGSTATVTVRSGARQGSSVHRTQHLEIRDGSSRVVATQEVTVGSHVYRLKPGTYHFVATSDGVRCTSTITVRASQAAAVVLDCGG